jgi:glyoxylase-like metal-dependent hydrolase (beta-lactamase superfamily II)
MRVIKLHGTVWALADDEKGILIDAGLSGQEEALLKKVHSLGLKIPLIFLTHTHYDHTGCVEAFRKATGAKVIVSAKESGCLRQGYTPVPKGTGRLSCLISRAGHKLDAKHREHYTPVTQDIIEISERMSLEPYGFHAQVWPLGAHTEGSIGLVAGDYFFAGDTVFGIGHIVYPLFANFPQQISSVWQTIIDSGAKYVCPGHGRMLHLAELQRHYQKRFNRPR